MPSFLFTEVSLAILGLPLLPFHFGAATHFISGAEDRTDTKEARLKRETGGSIEIIDPTLPVVEVCAKENV